MARIQGNRDTVLTSEKTKIVVAEDHTLFAGVLPELLHRASSGEIEVVRLCLDRSELFRTLRKTTPDVLLCDVWMPHNSGERPRPCDASWLGALKRQNPNTAIVLLSGNANAALVKSLLDAGAGGFLDKNVAPEQICQVIEWVRKGGRYVVPRLQAAIDLLDIGSGESIRTQLLKGRKGDVLRLLLEGWSPTEIAAALPIGKKYVDKKIAEIKSILGVNTHIRILHACIELGITNHLVADSPDNLPHYDAARALRIAGGIPALRDQTLNSTLELFSDGGELAVLFDVSCYRSDPTQSRALAHSAAGLAQQGAMPRLESLCRALDTALEQEEFVTAEALGRKLPATVASVRAAVATESGVRSGT